MDYDTFTKIYNGTVSPIMEYSSGVWGYKVYERLERLQYRAIRTFLGVGKFTPIPAITGEMGWTPPYIRNRCNMIRLWCRLVNLDLRRIPYRIFKWDMHFSIAHRDTWSNDVKSIMTDCGLRDLFDSSHTDGLSARFLCSFVEGVLMQKHCDRWIENVNNMPKLRTYQKLNNNFGVRPYLCENLTRQERSALARLRCETFSLEIEKGRYRNLPVERRVCKVCGSGDVEDEMHFMLDCSIYTQQRNELFTDFQVRNDVDFSTLNRTQILYLLLNIDSKRISRYIVCIANLRILTLSNQRI